MSTYRDQKRYIEALKKYERQFTGDDFEQYRMFVQRHKDEDEFDSVSMKKLKELFEKYYKPVDTSQYDKYFKKPES